MAKSGIPISRTLKPTSSLNGDVEIWKNWINLFWDAGGSMLIPKLCWIKSIIREKTIKIRIAETEKDVRGLLFDVKDYEIDFNSGTNITIRSNDSEEVLIKILQILTTNNISIEYLSVMPTTLEEIFLTVVKNSNASNN